MIKVTKSLICLLLSLMLITSNSIISHAEVKLPEKVRVGLFFGSTGASVVKVWAKNGIQMGMYNNNKFSLFLKEAAIKTALIRKDGNYIFNDNAYTEYDIKKGTSLKGTKLGAYHIQIGGNYSDLKSAKVEAENLNKAGVSAYAVFADAWQVWTGFYVDEAAAKADLANLQKSLGEECELKVIDPDNNRIVIYSSDGKVALLFGSSTGVFQIHPEASNDPYILNINGSNYRGELEIRRFSDSDMTVINIIDLEEYLYGVVPCEIEAVSHSEAIKAQAVAARTYACGNLKKYAAWDFDLTNTVASQVYRGFDSEYASTTKAVNETKGKVLTYKGELAKIFFFSSSGGMTENVKNVWGSEIPYLVGVEDKYESGKSWNYNWNINLDKDQVKSLMQKAGSDLGDILSVEATKYSTSGSVIELVITGTKDKKVFVNGQTRTVLGLNSQKYKISSGSGTSVLNGDNKTSSLQLNNKKVITSSGIKELDSNKTEVKVLSKDTYKNLSLSSTGYVFTGKGWGHSVGLSQEGAKGMANANFKYDEILEHYFSGTEIQ